MIVKGVQNKRMEYSSRKLLEEIGNLKGFIDEGKAKYYLYKLFRNNPNLAAKWFLGVDLFPFQTAMLKGMFISDYSMYVLSRGCGKSYVSGIYCILSNILEGSNIGVISSVFRASKLTLQKAESILEKREAEMARSLCHGKTIITRAQDQWIMRIGNGKSLALPFGDGQKLRGFRFNRLVIDEFLNIPKKGFEEVILPFISSNEDAFNRQKYVDMEDKLIAMGKMEEHERKMWNSNKLILASSPSFKFEYMYEVYSKYAELILGKRTSFTDDDDEETEEAVEAHDSAYRLVYQMSYDCIPKQLYDIRMIKQAKETMSEMNFKREFGAQFVDESDGFFKLSKMMACTIEDGEFPAVEINGDESSEYILAIDPNASETTSADNFAMLLFKLNPEKKCACIVHAYAIAGLSFKDHINYLKYLLKNFNIVGICVDQYGGGDQFIKAANESSIFKNSNLKLGILEGTFNHLEEYKQDLITLKKSYDRGSQKICYLRAPTTSWINNANTQLQASIDHKKILFAARSVSENLNAQIKKDIGISSLNWNPKIQKECGDTKQLQFSFIENLKDLIEQTKIECANIEVKSTPQGHLSFQLAGAFKNLKGKDRPRKDLYSALVLGNWFVRTYFDMLEQKEEVQYSGFMPFIIN